MNEAERQEILNIYLPLPTGTRVKTVEYEHSKRRGTHDKENIGTIVEKNVLVGDCMYLVEFDEELPGCFGKIGENVWTTRHTGRNNLSWEYRGAIVRLEMKTSNAQNLFCDKDVYDGNREELKTIAIYNSPDDFPGKYVARLFNGIEPTDKMVLGETLEEVRGKMPRGYMRIPRHETDVISLVESWIY